MAKKPPAPPKRPPPSAPKPPPRRAGSAWPLVGTAGRGLVALALIAGTIALVVWLGGQAGYVVAPHPRYTVAFDKINIPPPPAHTVEDFLTEVRYVSNLPGTVQNVDPNLRPTLAAAFARHAWVAQVDGVDVGADGTIRVRLQYRTAVLAVTVAPEAKGGPTTTGYVDRAGVILPGPVPDEKALARLVTPQPPTKLNPGQTWANESVVKAADLAVRYRPKRIEKVAGKWRLEHADGRRQDINDWP